MNNYLANPFNLFVLGKDQIFDPYRPTRIKEYLPEHVLVEQMNNNFLPLSIIPIILLLLIPASLVFGQTNPWALFQQLCQGGAFATGPQCQNLGTSSSPTTSSTTTNGVCGTNAILQNGVCVPTTSSTITNGG